MNARYLEERKITPLYMLEAIWTKEMQRIPKRCIFNHGKEVINGQRFTKFAAQHQFDRQEIGRRIITFTSS